MKKTVVSCLLALCLWLTGCAGDTVIYQVECDHDDALQTVPEPEDEGGEAVKTGLALWTDLSGSRSAEGASYRVLAVAVLVDDSGVIRDCRVDGVRAALAIDANGAVGGVMGEVPTLWGSGSSDEGDLRAIADYAVGRQAAELRLDPGPIPTDWVAVLETAAQRARHLGAEADDALQLALWADLSDSRSAADAEAGQGRLNCDVAAITFDDEVITACYIDSLQADVTFDAMGTLLNDVTAPVKTKNELGEDYGMKAYGGAKYEWYEQAEHFARYVTGKTAAQVAAIPTAEGRPSQADLYTSVTISVTPFQRLVALAAQQEAAE